jgi:soluble lytic murein transglycosylase
MMQINLSAKLVYRISFAAAGLIFLGLLAWRVAPYVHERWCGHRAVATPVEPLEPLPAANANTAEEQAALALPAAQRGKKLVQLARAYEQGGKFADAARLFLLAIPVMTEVADGLLDEAARLEMAAGNYADTVAVLKRLANAFADRPVAADARGRLAEAYEKLGDVRHAATAHRAAASASESDNAKAFHLVRAGELLEQAGKPAEAAKLFDEVLRRPGFGRYSGRAMTAYCRAALANDPARQADYAASFGLRAFAAKAYETAGPALDFAVHLRREQGASPAALHELIDKAALALFAIHDNERAIEYTKMLVEQAGEDRAEALYRLCKLHLRQGDAAETRSCLDRLRRGAAGGRYERYVLYELHWLDILENRYAAAYRYFDLRSKQRGGNKESVEWLGGWTAYRAGRIDAALAHLNAIAKLRRVNEPDRYAYWRGRMLWEKGDHAAGLAVLRSLNQQRPTGYYGWRSGEWLAHAAEPVFTVGEAMNPAPSSAYSVAPPHRWWTEYNELSGFASIVRYLDADLPRAAAAALARVNLPKKLAPPHAYALAQICAQARRFDLARELAGRSEVYDYLRGGNVSLLNSYYLYALPAAYADYVSRYADRFHVPPAFVYAIMLNESAFHPQIVSRAYAVGLMQILPPTGQQIAAALGETFDEQSLFDPQTNIRYGCWYLRSLLDALGGDPALAAAAYNAGPNAVQQWRAHKPGVAQEIFVEEIPYTETSRYVRRVLASTLQYEVILEHNLR